MRESLRSQLVSAQSLGTVPGNQRIDLLHCEANLRGNGRVCIQLVRRIPHRAHGEDHDLARSLREGGLLFFQLLQSEEAAAYLRTIKRRIEGANQVSLPVLAT